VAEAVAAGLPDPDWTEHGYCSHCDLFIGYGALGVYLPPEDKDEDWLRSHCWCCGRSRLAG
jgi:hypothetical protein